MRYMTFIIMFVFLLGCTDNPSSSVEEFDSMTLSKLESTGEAGAEASVAVTDMESDMETLEDMDVIQMDDAGSFSLEEFANNFQASVEMYRGIERMMNKVDSILVSDTTNIPGGGVRITHIVYDTETQLGHIYESSDFTDVNHRAMDFDSTHIVLDMGPDPWDFRDDVFKTVYEYRHYRDKYRLEYSESAFILNEVTQRGRPVDFTMTTDQHFRDFSRLALIQVAVERHNDKSGRVYQKITDQEGNTFEHERIFNKDGTGSFTRTLPNGVSVSGTFNILRDDNVGGFTRVTIFPTGFELSQISIVANFIYDSVDLKLTGDIEKIYTLASGEADTVNVSILRQFAAMNDRLPLFTTVSMTSSYGMSSYLKVEYASDTAELAGWWITADGHYAVLTGDRYFGDLSTLSVALYENEEAFIAGDAPLATAVFETMPDGSGEATITVGDETYTFSYDSSGKGTLKGLNGAVKAVEVRI